MSAAPTTSSSQHHHNHGHAHAHGKKANKLHVLHCFDSIIEKLNGKAHHHPIPHQWNGDKFPLFVTWKKRHGHGGEWRLRGCIGTFAAKELQQGLREYAVIAAFHDTRFNPIEASELTHLRCDISLLTNFEKRPPGSITDWTIGVHGIQIDFTDPVKQRSYSATFLPEVAKEQGWSHEETIEELVHKSGYRGSLTADLKGRINLTRYQSEKESLTYDAYITLREDVVNGHKQSIVGIAHITGEIELKHKSKHGVTPASDQVDEDGDEGDGTAHHQKRAKLSATPNK